MTSVLTWMFSRSLYGPAALILAVVVSFSPDMLAHGGLTTSNVYLAAAVIGSLLAFDALLSKPGWPPAIMLGIAVGAGVALQVQRDHALHFSASRGFRDRVLSVEEMGR